MMSREETREEFGSILLQTIFERPIQKIRIIPQNNVLGINTDRHGIRMDAYIEEIRKGKQAVSEESFNGEEENTDKGLNAI